MSNARIEITADNQDTANALAAVVGQGLSTAGFTNVSHTEQIDNPDTLLAEVSARAPELFETNIEVSAVAIVEDTPSEDVEAEEEAVEAAF